MKGTLHGRMTVRTAEERLTEILGVPNVEVKIFNCKTGRDIPDHAKIISLRKKIIDKNF